MFASIEIFVGILFLVCLAMRGMNIIVIAPLAALIIILTNGMDLQASFFSGQTAYLSGMAGFVKNFLPIFILGAVLGKYLEDSKATVTIANSIFKLTGRDNAYTVFVAIAIIAAVLTYGGVSMFIVIFTVVALARPIMKELDLPWHLVMIPLILGGTSFTMTMLPGTPSIQNIIPTQLGTPLTAAPLLSIIATVVSITYGMFYMKWYLNKTLTAGEHYEEKEAASAAPAATVTELPSLFLSVLPMVVLIVTIFIGSSQKIQGIILPALAAAIIVAAVGLHKYIPSQMKTLNAGAVNSLLPLLFTAAAVGVGTVVASAPGFHVIESWLQFIPGGPLVQIVVYTGFLSMVTASASGALGIVIPLFGHTWIAAGIDPEIVHRIAAITSGIFSAMPHSGFIFSCMAVFGLSHRQVYKQVFGIGLVGGLVSLAVSLFVAYFLY